MTTLPRTKPHHQQEGQGKLRRSGKERGVRNPGRPPRAWRRTGGALGLSLWLACAGVSGHAAGPSTPSIRFAPEKDYPPFIFVDEQGRLQGLSVDILEAIKPQLGLTIETLPAAPLAQILSDLKAGRADLVSSLRSTEERRDYLDFSAPYALVPAVLVTREPGSAPTLQDLIGQPVAVGQGYAVEGFVRQRHPDIRWVLVPDDAQALKLLASGQVQGVVADIASVRYVTKQLELKGLQVRGPVGFDYHLSFAWRKELQAVGASVDRALLNLNPRVRQVALDRWLSEPASGDTRSPALTWPAVIAVLIGVLLLVAAWRLRRQTKP